MSNEQNDQNAAPFQNPEGFEDADFQIGGNGGPEGSDAESSSSSSDIVGKFYSLGLFISYALLW